jgi:hypothetical protein
MPNDMPAASATSVHTLAEVTMENLAVFEPLGLGPTIEVDTAGSVDICSVARDVRAGLDAAL